MCAQLLQYPRILGSDEGIRRDMNPWTSFPKGDWRLLAYLHAGFRNNIKRYNNRKCSGPKSLRVVYAPSNVLKEPQKGGVPKEISRKMYGFGVLC